MGRMRHFLVGTGIVGALFLAGADVTVTYYEEALPTTMNPLFAKEMPDHRTNELVFDRMFYRSAITNELKSRIVDRYEILEGGKKVKLVLKEGAKWHDDKPLSPGDVCFTISAMLDEKTPSPVAKHFREAIATCETSDKENAVLVGFKRFYHEPREHLGFFVIPKHLFQGTAVSPELDFSLRPIGTGPMKGSKGKRAVSFTSFPNAHHDAKIAALSMAEGQDPNLAIHTLIGGSVHGMVAVPPPQRPEVAAQDEVSLKSYDLRSWWFVAVNTGKGPLKDKRVRQALNMTLDRQELRELTIGVTANDTNPPCEFISGPFVQSSPYYNRQVPILDRADKAKVTELMLASGAKEVGGRWTFNDQPLTLRIGMDAPLDSEARDLLNQIGNQFQAGGFDRQVYRITRDDWTRKATTGQMTDFDLLIGKWSFGLVEDVNPMFNTRAGGKGSLNVFNYSNPATDGILARYESAKTDTEARDAYHELHKQLSDELPYLFLWKLDTKSAWRNEIRNNTISPYYYFSEYDGWKYDASGLGGTPTPPP